MEKPESLGHEQQLSWKWHPKFVFFNFFHVYWFWERGEWERGSKRGRERTPSRLCTDSTEPDAGLDLRNLEIMTWAEIKSQMLNQLSHPGAPIVPCLYFKATNYHTTLPSLLVSPTRLPSFGERQLYLIHSWHWINVEWRDKWESLKETALSCFPFNPALLVENPR